MKSSKESLSFRNFKSDQDEMWLDCSSSKYALIDGVTFLVLRHIFKMAVVISFHVEKCCHLMSAHAASARRLSSSVR